MVKVHVIKKQKYLIQIEIYLKHLLNLFIISERCIKLRIKSILKLKLNFLSKKNNSRN